MSWGLAECAMVKANHEFEARTFGWRTFVLLNAMFKQIFNRKL